MVLPPKSHKQAHQLAVHLLDLKNISGLEAQALYRITSVTKVISVLQQKYGFSISKEWRYDHTGKRYVRYSVAE